MSTIQGFHFTHRKRADGAAVGVLESQWGEVIFAYESGGQLYSLKYPDFQRRFISL